ncbi:hypothetical protein CF642_38165, partial [Burkholderia pseudomallei]
MNDDPVETLRRPPPRRRRITGTHESASPPRPLSGIAPATPLLPACEPPRSPAADASTPGVR